MTSAIAAMLPFSFDTNKENDENIAKAKMRETQFRITSVNQMLVSLLDIVETDPSFWLQINDIAMLKANFTANKRYIDEMRNHFMGESKTVALLDNMKKTIIKLESLMPKESEFNFDLARMKERVNGEFVQLPSDITLAKDIKAWLLDG
ncbi:hypothetical protein A4G18_01520 [Pasteurellaceae bacterium Pebbles2]|nr:hypothetical protein [Pasteurellaceae bacterium Pebbles2]